MLIMFSYNFLHHKTQDYIFYCHHYGIKIDAVIAADYVELNFPPKKYRYHIRRIGQIHPRDLCKKMDIPYYVAHHNSSEALEILDSYSPDLGIISGARILKQKVIDKFNKGIINIHPGLIPESRGLDTPHWSVYNDIPLGVTSHFIDKRVDAGWIIKKHILPVYSDDTLIDISLRLYEGQLEILEETIQLAISNPKESFPYVKYGEKKPYGIFPSDKEGNLLKKLKDYINKHAS